MIKLMVVDDETGICDIIKKIFVYVGFSVVTTTKSGKAMDIVARHCPKIVFVGVDMKEVGGLELLKTLKAFDQNIMVIMLNNKRDEVIKEEAIRLGADEFIEKPFSRNYLRDLVVQRMQDLLSKGGHMQRPSFLIVDDEQDILDLLEENISEICQCDIEKASNGEQAIEKATSIKPDLILLDIKMPGMSGMDVIARVQRESPDSKILIISAWKSKDVINQALEMGVVDYIEKPVTYAALREKLKTILLSMGKFIEKA